MSDHLWEPEHPHYCEEGGAGPNTHGVYPSWAAFHAEFGHADLDYNHVWRWDWEVQDEMDERLVMFVMHQRTGHSRSYECPISSEDEPAVRAFLQRHWEVVQALWAPFGVTS